LELPNNAKDFDAWWNGLSYKQKADIMRDRMSMIDLKRQKYRPITPEQFWSGCNVVIKSIIHAKFSKADQTKADKKDKDSKLKLKEPKSRFNKSKKGVINGK